MKTIPKETVQQFAQVVLDSTYWNEADLTPRQAEHIAACVAEEVAVWAEDQFQYQLRERIERLHADAFVGGEGAGYLKALTTIKSMLKERPKETPVAE